MAPAASPRALKSVAYASLALCAVVCLSAFRGPGRVEAVETASPLQDTLPVPDHSSRHLTAHPVVVELFTSEGCSSCPPADDLLLRLDRQQPVPGADIIVLSEHVDYWDRLGWKDRFSSHEFTERQQEYQSWFKLDDIYTPQAVVNGSAQFNGADGKGIFGAIQSAANSNAIPLRFADVQIARDRISFRLAGAAPATPGYVNVYAALVDPATTTEILAGENKGRTLRQAGVVRTFARVGSSWRSAALGEGSFMLAHTLPGPLNGMRLIVLVQTKHIGPILGAVSCLIAPAASQDVSAATACPRAAGG